MPCATARSQPNRSGVDLLRYKALAFGISGFYAGVAGGLYSAMLNFVAPEGFDLFQMIMQKAMIVVGGLGSITGSVLGASIIILLLELLRAFKGLQEIAFGALLVGFVLFMRGGLIAVLQVATCRGWEEPSAHDSRAIAAPEASPQPEAPDRAWPTNERAASVRCATCTSASAACSVLEGINLAVEAGWKFAGSSGPTAPARPRCSTSSAASHRPQQGEHSSRRRLDRRPQTERHRATGAGPHLPDLAAVRGMTVLENMMTGLHRRRP